MPFKSALVLALICAIGALDFLTGYELAFSLFYVLPIAFAAWSMGRLHGIAASVASTLVLYWADTGPEHYYSQPLIPLWNAGIGLSLFLIIAVLLSALKSSMEHEQELARTDYLTGAVNSRLFFELAQWEINRSLRNKNHLTLAYIDLDNFKFVNDQLGHAAGDDVLRAVVGFAKKNLRTTDVIARLGGDEFALLLPETGQQNASAVLAKLIDGLGAEMQRNGWPITFSVGVVTCSAAPVKAEELVKIADQLMYSVKHGGKNELAYCLHAG